MPAEGMTLMQNPASKLACEVFVGNIPPETQSPTLQEYLGGALVHVGLCKPPNPIMSIRMNARFAFLEMRTAEDATAALNLDGIPFNTAALSVGRPKKYEGPVTPHKTWFDVLAERSFGLMGQPGGAAVAEETPSSTVVRLGNVVTPEELTDDEAQKEVVEDMTEECSKYGAVAAIEIPHVGGAAAGVGFVFVKYHSREDAQKAKKSFGSRTFDGKSVDATYFPEEQFAAKSFAYAEWSVSRKQGYSRALERRSKQYFFKLLSAARKRDKRLLASAMKSLGADKEYLDHMRSADPELAGSFHVQDVLLKAASRCGQPILADKLFTTMLARGQRPTQHTTGAFLDALKRSRQADRCVSVYAGMMDSGVHLGDVCFNIVVSALVQDGNFAGGIDMLERASTKWGVTPDAFTFNIFFSAAAKQNSSASRDAAEQAGKLMSQFGVAPDRVTINAQIDHAIKQGRPSEATEIFERALEGGFPGVVPDVITFNVGISAYLAQHMEDRAFEVLDEMNRRGVHPRADTFNSILTGLSKAGDTLGVIEVFNRYMRQDDRHRGNTVAPTLVTYNLMLQALCLENDKGQARRVAFEMKQRGVKPDNITLAALVRLQYSREDVYEVMEIARKLRIRPSLTFLNSCIRALGDHSDVYGACQVMERIKALENVEPDVISYNSLVYALVQEPWVFEVALLALME
eukprot:g2115.t1